MTHQIVTQKGEHHMVICCSCKKEKELNNLYMSIANSFAGLSKDPKFKVGSLIVTPEGILYPGYNGDEIGGSNQRDSLDTGQSGFVHAEANAILKFNPTIHRNCKMYITFKPCTVCARMIVNTQAIYEVWYDQEYSADMKGVEILQARGIRCEKL